MSVVFSPNNLQLLKADASQLSLDFNTDSAIEIFNIQGLQMTSAIRKQFSASFNCCDWSFSDIIAAGGDQGNLVICKADKVKSAELLQICDADITTVRFSAESEDLVAVGTSIGEVLFLNTHGELSYTTRNKTGQNPHQAAVRSIRWNPRVPRVCCSIDEAGLVIVWDTKKKGAVMSFQVKGGVDCCFSEQVATYVYALTAEGTVETWDLRNRNERYSVVQCQKNATSIRFFEGVEDVLGVYGTHGIVESFDVSQQQQQKIGQQELGNQFSFVYPNLWLSQYDNVLQLQYKCILIRNKPILFNRKILSNQMQDSDPELIQIVKKPISLSSRNVLRHYNSNQIMQTKVQDCSEIITQIEAVLTGSDVQMDEKANNFIKLIGTDKQQLLNEVIPEAAAKQEKPQTQQNNVNDVDFFDDTEADTQTSQEKQVKSQSIKISSHLTDFLLNGKIHDCLEELVQQNNFSIAFYIMIQLNLPKNDIQKYLHLFQENVQIVSDDNIQANEQLQTLLHQISMHQYSLHSNKDWRDYLKLIRAYNSQKLQTAIHEVIQHLQSVNQDTDSVVKLMVYSNLHQQALEEVIKHIQNLNLQKKLNFALQLQNFGLHYNCQELEKIVQVVQAQGKQQLCDDLCNRLKLSIKKPAVAPSSLIPQHQPPLNTTTRPVPPSAGPLAGKPLLVQSQPQPPAYNQPQIQPTSIAPPENNFFNITSPVSVVNSQPVSAVSAPPPSQPMLAVDMFGYKNNAQPAQPQQHQVGLAAPSAGFFSTPPPQNNVFTPQPPPPPPAPSASTIPGVFQPQPPAPTAAPNMLSFQNNALATRGSVLVAPPPPTVDGSSAPVPPIQVSTTTAPRNFNKQKPIQQLFTGGKGMELIDKITLKTDLSNQFFGIIQQYSIKDSFGFLKNAMKLGDLLLHLADYQDVPNLMSQPLLDCMQQIIAEYTQQNYSAVQKSITEFGKHSGEIAAWSGSLKLMAISLGK